MLIGGRIHEEHWFLADMYTRATETTATTTPPALVLVPYGPGLKSQQSRIVEQMDCYISGKSSHKPKGATRTEEYKKRPISETLELYETFVNGAGDSVRTAANTPYFLPNNPGPAFPTDESIASWKSFKEAMKDNQMEISKHFNPSIIRSIQTYISDPTSDSLESALDLIFTDFHPNLSRPAKTEVIETVAPISLSATDCIKALGAAIPRHETIKLKGAAPPTKFSTVSLAKLIPRVEMLLLIAPFLVFPSLRVTGRDMDTSSPVSIYSTWLHNGHNAVE
jgi:hypothetical protein